MSVSVVIPAYNSSKTIVRAVESVLAQTVQPEAILVVDDGSTDDVGAVLLTYPVKLLRKPNGGASSARNLGIDQAKGDWIAFLDSDDYWEPTKLEKQLAVAAQYPEVKIIGCRWYMQEPGCARTEFDVAERYVGQVLNLSGPEAFRLACSIWTGGLMIRRSDGDRFVSGLEPAEDRDLWIRLVSRDAVYILPERLSTYVQEPGGISRSNVDTDCTSMLRVIHNHAAMLGPEGLREQLTILYRRWAGCHLARGRSRKAIQPALRRLQLQPVSLQAWWIVAKSIAGSLKPAGSSPILS